MTKKHSDKCVSLIVNNFEKKSDTISNYKEFIDKCYKYLDSTEEYNKQEFTKKLQNIYNENKYNFSLKENTIKNIISTQKKNSLRFTKFNAILNNYNKNKELILWEHTNIVIYVSNKKDRINVEYFIWTINSIIAWSRLSKHYFIDATFHHPKDYEELIIIIFKDTGVHEYFPCFYILVNNKSEVMYDLVLNQ